MVSAVKTASLGLEVYEQTRSLELFERAERVIPGAKLGGSVICPAGMYGHYSPNAMAPGYPIYFSDARGARFWDVDGNEYVDYMCAYGPMVLGYKNRLIEEAVRKQNEKSNTVSLAAPLMVELAEYLVGLVPIADWAFFSKNGSGVDAGAGDPRNRHPRSEAFAARRASLSSSMMFVRGSVRTWEEARRFGDLSGWHVRPLQPERDGSRVPDLLL